MITEFKEFKKPAKVYIPLTDVNYKIASVDVAIDDVVKAGQVLARKYKGKVKLPVISSVSGTVVGFEVLQDRYGKKVDHCVIENDGLNEQVELGKYEDPTTNQIRKTIQDLGLVDLNVDGSFTPLLFDKKIDYLVVNSVFVNEPSYSIDYYNLQVHAEEIASGIKLLAKALLLDTATLLVDKRVPKETLEELGKATVDKNINLITVDPGKVDGQELRFIKNLLKRDITPNLLESGVMYVDTDAAKMINDVMSNGLVPTSRSVALTGDGIKSNVVYDVTYGTLLSDLVNDLEGYNDCEEVVVHVGDFITGNQVTTDQFAITQNVNAINISEFRDTEEDVCIKCGDCNDVCPVGILPQNIMDAELRSVNQRIIDLQTNLCTECGLCSYVCPSKINVLEWVRRAKRRVG
jgi:electron transport complex protein RnfC